MHQQIVHPFNLSEQVEEKQAAAETTKDNQVEEVGPQNLHGIIQMCIR